MATPIWLTGFENGANPSTSGGVYAFVSSGTVTVVSDEHNTGSFAFKSVPTGSVDAYVRKTIAGTPNNMVGRFYFKVGSAPASAQPILDFTLTTAGSSGNPRIYINPTGNKVELRQGTSTVVATSGGGYTVNQWHYVDFHFDIDTNPWTLKAKLDGGTEFSGNASVAADTFAGIRLGNTNAVAYTVYLDDIILSTTVGNYPIGAGGTEGLLPASDGTHNAGTNVIEDNAGNDINGTSVTAYNKINSAPPSATVYLRQAANGTGNYAEVNFANISHTHTTVHGAWAWLTYTSETTTQNRGGCIVSKDSFSTSSTIWGAPGATADYSDGSTAAPFYKNAQVANVTDDTTTNALQARLGYSDDAAPDPYWIDLIVEVGYAIATGTQYNQSASGGITPSGSIAKEDRKVLAGTLTDSGAITKQGQKTLSGSISSIVGTLTKQTEKALSGALSSIVGTLTASRIFSSILSGSLTPDGAISKQGQKVLSGSNTPSGALLRSAEKILGSTLTSSGNLLKQTNKVLSGVLSSIVGTLQSSKTTLLSLGGTLTSSGDLAKQANKLFSGALTSAGTIVNSAQKALSGTITSTGTLARQAEKLLGGTLTSAGEISKSTLKILGGILTSFGDLITEFSGGATNYFKDLAGSLTPSGTLIKSTSKFFSGTLTGAGDIVKTSLKSFTGTLTSSGSLTSTSVFIKILNGVLGLAGSISKQADKSYTGSLTPTGNASKSTTKSFSGSLLSSGVLLATTIYTMVLSGTLNFAGEVSKQTNKTLSGVMASAGQITKSISKFFSGVLDFIGTLIRGTGNEAANETHLEGSLIREITLDGTFVITLSMEGTNFQEELDAEMADIIISLSGKRDRFNRMDGKK